MKFSSKMRWMSKVWHDPVGGNVIAGCILAALLAIPTIGWWREIIGWLTTTTPIWNWLIVIIVICIGVGGYWILRTVWNRKTQKTKQPAHREYCLDKFEGVYWGWKYNENGKPTGLQAFCPADICKLIVSEIGMDFGTLMECPKCKGRWPAKYEIPELMERVENQIDHKISTGEWRANIEAFRNAKTSKLRQETQ